MKQFRRRRRPILVLLLAVATLLVTSKAGVARQKQDDQTAQGIESLRDRVKVHVLPNGMKFVLLERHTSPTVSFHVYFAVGSVDEPIGETGIAHLYEHMAFKGTKDIGTTNYAAESKYFPIIDKLEEELSAERDKGDAADKAKIAELTAEIKKEQDASERYIVPNELGKLFEKNGGNGLNAQTERDETHYLVNLPSNKIELWMAIESDRMKNEVLRQLYKERDVVMEEVRRTIDTNPIAKLVLQEVITTAYHAHPYGLHSGIGWTSDVSHLTRPEVEAFFKKYYGAANCTVAIVGDFDTAKVIPMIDKYFSSVPAGVKNPGVVTVEPPQEGERRDELEANVQPVLVLGYHRGNVLDKDAIVCDVIAQLLSSGRTSRFYRHLVEGKKVATTVFALPNPPLVTGKYPSLFEIIGFPLVPGHNVAELEKDIYAELDDLKTKPVSHEELQKIINQVDAAYVRSLESNATMAQALVFAEGLEGDWHRLLTYRQRLAAVSPDDVMRVSKQMFEASNRTVAYIVPKETEKAAPSKTPEATPEALAKGKAILEAARTAIGVNAVKVKDFESKASGELSFGQTVNAEFDEQVLLPDKLRSEINIPAMGQTIVQVLNGESAWMQRGGNSMDAPPNAVKDLKEALSRSVIESLLQFPDGSEPQAQALPDQEVGGKPADVVLLSGPGNFKMTLFLDKATHRPAKAEYQGTSPLTRQPAKAEVLFMDYREQNGLWIPFHTVLSYDGEKFADQKVSEVKVNSGLAESNFKKQ